MMGVQNAVVRRLAVPDMTTTLLTMTFTGIAADIRQSGWRSIQLARRFLAVGSMLTGALVGGKLVVGGHTQAAIASATGIMLIVTTSAAVTIRKPPGWRS